MRVGKRGMVLIVGGIDRVEPYDPDYELVGVLVYGVGGVVGGGEGYFER